MHRVRPAACYDFQAGDDYLMKTRGSDLRDCRMQLPNHSYLLQIIAPEGRVWTRKRYLAEYLMTTL